MKQRISVLSPGFDKLTSPRQRADLNAALRERFGAPLGTEIPYRSLRMERRGGVFWASMRAEWGADALDFTVRFLNATGDLLFSQDRMVPASDGGVDMVAQTQGRKSA